MALAALWPMALWTPDAGSRQEPGYSSTATDHSLEQHKATCMETDTTEQGLGPMADNAGSKELSFIMAQNLWTLTLFLALTVHGGWAEMGDVGNPRRALL